MNAQYRAPREILRGFADWRRWGWLGFNDVRLQHRRSALGSWWPTLSLAIFSFGVGLLFSELMGRPLEVMLPHVALGWLGWSLIQGGVVQGCGIFITGKAILQEAILPPNTLLLRVLTKLSLHFLMGLAVPFAAFAYVGRPVPLEAVSALAGIALNLIALHGAMLFLGSICAKLRDMEHLVEAAMRLAFFLTPIIWLQEQSNSARTLFVDYNPFYYMIESIRAPFMDGRIPYLELGVTAALALAANLAGVAAYTLVRRRLMYWL